MDEQTGKGWSRPELVVIVRGKPGEAVLKFCKRGRSQRPWCGQRGMLVLVCRRYL